MKKFISFMLINIIICTVLCGCAESDANRVINAQFQTKAYSLDPQLASNRTERTVIINCFEGLFRLDKKGQPQLAAAKEYIVSEDGLSYTFTLHDNMLWSDETTPLTAHDYVFGLQRAVLPETLAPDFNTISKIKNAKKINNGKANVSTLGVAATDDKTLTITLEKPDSGLLYALAQPISMPCNQAFFESTKGKYGLDLDYVLCNGPFYLSKWNTESGDIRLSRFDEYKGVNTAKPSAISVAYVESSSEISMKLQNNYIDIGDVPSEDKQKLNTMGAHVDSVFNTSYSIYFNPDYSYSLRKALLQSCDFTNLALNTPSYYKQADGVVPVSSVDRAKKYTDNVSVGSNVSYNVNAAKKAYQQYLSDRDLDTFPVTTFYYPVSSVDESLESDKTMKQFANTLVQTWQKHFGMIVNTKAVAVSELEKLVGTRDFVFGIVPLQSVDNTAYSALKQVKYNDTKFKSLLNKANKTVDDTAYFNSLGKAEQLLLDNAVMHPLFCIASSISYSAGISDVRIAENGLDIDFTATGKISES